MLQRLYHYMGLLSTMYPQGTEDIQHSTIQIFYKTKKYVSEENTTEY